MSGLASDPTSTFSEAHIREFDPDRFLGAVAGGAVEHFLLGQHPCSADLQHWSGETVTIDRGDYHFGVLAQGAFRPGHVVVGIAGAARGGITVNGFEVEHTDLQFYAEGAEVFYRADRPSHWVAIQCKREILVRTAASWHVDLAGLPATGAVNLPGESGSGRDLWELVESVFADARDPESPPGSLETILLDGVVDALGATRARQDVRDRLRWSQRRIDLVRAAQARLCRWRDRPYDSAALCGALGVSERTLQLHFRQLVGTSPRRWDLLMRLHGARRELMAAGSGSGRVTGIALRWGFEHLGRFSAAYREQFGVAPSQAGLERSARG